MAAMGTCTGCRDGGALDFDVAMAFQPIVDADTGAVYAYEALVRGVNGEGAGEVLSRVTPDNRYAFDQRCRVRAIESAVACGMVDTGARLSINFLPNAVYSPMACIQLTLKTSAATGFPLERLVFEFTEHERMEDTGHVRGIVDAYRRLGFATALDDFGAGHSGLGLLANMQPDIIKLDMDLIRAIDTSLPRRMIVQSVVRLARNLGITLIAEGIETEAEYHTLRMLGIRYVQGYLIARPAFMALPPVLLPEAERAAEVA